MTRKLFFAIPSLIAAGFAPVSADAKAIHSKNADGPDDPSLLRIFKLDHQYDLAGHRSHSSHRSHGSHSSHRSSSGGSSYSRPSKLYSPPSPSPAQPVPEPKKSLPNLTQDPSTSNAPQSLQGLPDVNPAYGPPPPSLLSRPPVARSESVAPSSILPSTQSAAPKVLPGNSNKFQNIVRQVQLALFAYGYYSGQIDGIVGKETRAALSKMQSHYGLKVTGTVTPETLDALGIVAE